MLWCCWVFGENSRFSAGRGEDAGTSRNGKQCVRYFGYTKLRNPGWCATWCHCKVAKNLIVNLLNFKSVLPNNRAGLEYRWLLWEQSSMTRRRGFRFWQIYVQKNESVIIVLFGSEVARVWFGELQITCKYVLNLGANLALITSEENFPWRECLSNPVISTSSVTGDS